MTEKRVRFEAPSIGFFHIRLLAWMLTGWLGLTVSPAAHAGDALYFSLQPGSALPVMPSSLLVQSPSFISVPAGAVLTVRLMRGEEVAATSKLSFPQAYENTALIPSVPIAIFVPLGTSSGTGQPLPGASLISGEADLTRVAAEPALYRLVWELSSGVMGTPGRAIATGAPVSFIDLKLLGVSSAALLGDQKPGSILFFNRYTSSASNPAREDTMLNLTNTNPSTSTFVRMFLVNGTTCEVQRIDLCLAARQTVSYQMSDLDPGIKGYIVAVATNQAGEPVNFNWLTGNTMVKQGAANALVPFTTTISAFAVAKRSAGEVKAGTNNEAELIFDDAQYDRLPMQSAFDGIRSQANSANLTTLAMYRPLPSLSTGTANATIQITGWSVNGANQVISSTTNLTTACYGDFSVGALRLSPTPIGQLLPAGSTGWFGVATSDSQPLMGVQINSGPFNGGGNARSLSYVTDYRIKVPVATMTCTP